jgi:hypothetical protein
MARAIDDLKIMRQSTSSSEGGCTMAEVTETANKILFQFENFSDYTHVEISKIQSNLKTRKQACDTRI